MENFQNSSSELIDMAGGRFELVARMGNGDQDAVLFRTRMAAGKTVPVHSHIDPECFYVLSGRLEVFLADEKPHWRSVEAGQSLLAANGVRHAVRNPGEQAADMVVLTNGRLARYFRDAGRPGAPGADVAPPSREDIQRMIEVAKAYGYWLATPQESAAIIG